MGAFVDWAHGALGGLNGLVNNAGILRDGLLVKRDRTTGEIQKLPKDQWDAVIGVNLTGATLLARDSVAKMVAGARRRAPGRPRGRREHLERVAARECAARATTAPPRPRSRPSPGHGPSSGRPSGSAAARWRPGMVETPMTRGMNQKARDALVAAVPVGRIGEPEDLWLAREVRPRMRLLQRPHDRCRRRPRGVTPPARRLT